MLMEFSKHLLKVGSIQIKLENSNRIFVPNCSRFMRSKMVYKGILCSELNSNQSQLVVIERRKMKDFYGLVVVSAITLAQTSVVEVFFLLRFFFQAVVRQFPPRRQLHHTCRPRVSDVRLFVHSSKEFIFLFIHQQPVRIC